MLQYSLYCRCLSQKFSHNVQHSRLLHRARPLRAQNYSNCCVFFMILNFFYLYFKRILSRIIFDEQQWRSRMPHCSGRCSCIDQFSIGLFNICRVSSFLSLVEGNCYYSVQFQDSRRYSLSKMVSSSFATSISRSFCNYAGNDLGTCNNILW